MEAKFEELIAGYINNNIGISETFLSLDLATALQKNLLRLKRDSRMISAGIGNAPVKDKNQKTRGDKTCWLEASSKNDAEMEFLDIIRQFMMHLNRTCFTSINTFEFHYALYEQGTSYARHKDQLKNDYNRKFSMVAYLNENWTTPDGGQLILHHEHGTQQIAPNNQKAIFFQSEIMEHEVAIANKPRMSVTGWLKRV